MERPKIKRCPFCGAKVTMKRSPFMGTWAFVCWSCGADVMFYGAEGDEDAALKKWNRRDYHGEETENERN